MSPETQFNFLHVKNGRAYFARVVVVATPEVTGVQLLINAGEQNSHTPDDWLKASCAGAARALKEHLELGGNQTGLTISSVIGTEVDTREDVVEVTAACAAWKALGHEESQLKVEFNGEWTVKFVIG